MKSRLPGGIILLFAILMVISAISGCIQESATPQQSSQRKEMGLRDVTGSPGIYPVSLEEALESMQATNDNYGQSLSGYSVHYIQGDQVEVNGAAFRWMIGLKKGNTRLFYHYSAEGASVVPWSAWFPLDTINLNLVMMPNCLISSEVTIQALFTDREYLTSIELVKNTYTLNVDNNGLISSYRYSARSKGPCPTPNPVNEQGRDNVPK